MSSTTKLLLAIDFAATKHRNQRRKNAEATPYINHPIKVALLLSESGETDDDVLIGAVLHDTIEDTDTTCTELEDTFSASVADLVMEVTDDKSLPKKDRKKYQVEHSKDKSPAAKKIKIADKICNLVDIYGSPPDKWDNARKQEYIVWAKQVVDSIRGVNKKLEERFDAIFDKCIQHFKE